MLRSTALLLVVLPASLCMAATIQVPADYATIQAAIDAAAEGDTVLVAPGEYVITEPITYRGKGITVRGVAGPEATTIRMAAVPIDPARASVIIFENGETNASALDGFTISGGQGTLEQDTGRRGGGILYTSSSSPALTNCIIRENTARNYGAGVYVRDSAPTFSNCVVFGNTTECFGGGACFEESSPTLTDCAISGNKAWFDGGGVLCVGSSVTMTNSTVSGNSGYWGGGVYCGGSSVTMTNCRIIGNRGEAGVGVSSIGSTLSMRDCSITGNYASDFVGGVLCEHSIATLTNCLIAGNAAFVNIGGLSFYSCSATTVTNCTIVENSTLWDLYADAAALRCDRSSITVTNCIVWQNYENSISGLPDVRYSCIQSAGVYPGEGNINSDPLFDLVGYWHDCSNAQEFGCLPYQWDDSGVPIAWHRWISGDYHLQPGSPCIDAGTSEGAPTTDIEGNTRPCGLAVDMGAYEYCPARQLTLTSAGVAECAPAHVFVFLTNEQPVQAFSLGVAHDPAVATLAAIDFVNCPVVQALNGGEGPDYFGVDLAPGTGNCSPEITAGGTVYCIASEAQPSTVTIPAGSDQPIARLTYDAVPGHPVGTETPLAIVACLGGELPREVVVTIDGLSYTPNTIGGTLTVDVPACWFIRGDANGDGRMDISDVVTLLMYMFESGRGPLRCEDAGDANDDGALDIADPIRILGRLFAEGTPFARPYPGCGTDPTPDSLTCATSQACVEASVTLVLPGNVPLTMVSCPGGTFLMGRYPGEESSHLQEDWQHRVILTRGFHFGTYEVTKRQWQAVMGTTPWAGQSYVLNDPNSPAVYVTWNDAQTFIAAVNALGQGTFSLPTEAQWEYACRAGTTTRFYWGDDPDYTQIGNYAWYRYNAYDVGEQYAHVVGQKLPNAWGLYDMSGNVWEWCQDWFEYPYSSATVSDPAGPPAGARRVLRPGSWRNRPWNCRQAYRGSITEPWDRYDYLGFRIARISPP